MGYIERLILSVLLLTTYSFGQLPSSRCDSVGATLTDCAFMTPVATDDDFLRRPTITGNSHLLDDSEMSAPEAASSGQTEAFISPPARVRKEGFHWGRALFESFTFLAIEQGYVVHDDYRWVTVENGVPFNHYWRDYKQSLSAWVHSGWDDGDPVLYSYVGHPIQGALTGYIQIQNDPQGRALELSNTKAYWWSRFKAFMWNAAYSTEWNIGPLSELTVEKYGTQARPPWNKDGSWPCTRKPCVTGVGQVDLVTTPVGGFAWILTEDLLDKQIARRVESATTNRFLIDFTRCALNPIRGGANIVHGKRPWYRASRDPRSLYSFNHNSLNQHSSNQVRQEPSRNGTTSEID
jgi:hypothetical protein